MFTNNIQTNSSDFDVAGHEISDTFIETIDSNIIGDIYFVDTNNHIIIDTMLSDIYEDIINDTKLGISDYNEDLYPEVFYENNPEDIAMAAYDDSSLLEASISFLTYNNLDDSANVGGYHNNDWLYYWANSKISTD